MTHQDAALADVTAAAPQGGRRMITIVGPVVVCLALLSALVTFLVLGGFTPIVPNHYVVIGLLGFDGIAILLLLAIILREIWPVVQARTRS